MNVRASVQLAMDLRLIWLWLLSGCAICGDIQQARNRGGRSYRNP